MRPTMTYLKKESLAIESLICCSLEPARKVCCGQDINDGVSAIVQVAAISFETNRRPCVRTIGRHDQKVACSALNIDTDIL
jgi:hypothetical protein